MEQTVSRSGDLVARRRVTSAAVLLMALLLQGVVDRAVRAQQAPAGEPRNFDARRALPPLLLAEPTVGPNLALQGFAAGRPDLAFTSDDRFGTIRTLYDRLGYLTDPDPRPADAIALDFVTTNLAVLGLQQADLNEYQVADVAVNQAAGSTHVYLRQVFQGLPVYNGQLHVNVNRDGRIMSVNNGWVPALAAAVGPAAPALTAGQAVQRAAGHLGLAPATTPSSLGPPEGKTQRTQVDPGGVSIEPIDAELMWLPIRRGDVRLVWNFQVHTGNLDHAYDMTVDAGGGDVWTRFDWVAGDSYRVYPAPVESPGHLAPAPPGDARTVVSDPADPIASPFGWHDTNGVAGADYTLMRGNNVHAYEDGDADGVPPVAEPDCGPTLDCDFPIDLAREPSAYTSAAVANLFYWNNYLHDSQYQYGFTETAGNFQANNYGRGGAGGDDVRAEAQDGGGLNNANFLTPGDGARPRMQMYLWNTASPDVDGDLDNGIIVHEYGHGISNRLVGGPAAVSCLNNRQQPGEGLSDWWALVYTATAGDAATDGRGIGTYALGEPATGLGIRSQRYSTDPAVNTWTYESIDGMSIPHGVGSVWAQAAWEMYWALVHRHGFSADLTDGDGSAGNQRALLYMNEGLMNTACSPTFTDLRDGIIQAATDNHGGEDACTLWFAFAGMGLGADAVSGGSGSVTPTNGFEVPAACLAAAPRLSVSDVTVAEGDSGTTSADFQVSLSEPSPVSVSVAYTTANGTANASASGTNATSISVPGAGSSGNGGPYPSTIAITGEGLTVQRATVTLHDVFHTYPADIDVLLVGPQGQSMVLMSDAGGSTDITPGNPVTLTFDDDAAAALTSGPLATGTYRPTNLGSSDDFASPAPAGPYDTVLAVFDGTDPAGEWRLFVHDDAGADLGAIAGGWSLDLEVTGAFADYVPQAGRLVFAPGETARTLSVQVIGDLRREGDESFTLNLSDATYAQIGDAQGQATITDDDAVWTLTVTSAGSGNGIVTSSPAGITCGGVCAAGFDHGTTVTLTPTAADGDVFTGWSGACGGAGPACDLLMTADRVADAVFTALLPLDPPTSLTATPVSTTRVDLAWEDASADESDFHVERALLGTGAFAEVTVVAGTALLGLTDTGLQCGRGYDYRIRAHRHVDGGYSAYSAVVSAVTQTCPALPAPTGVSAWPISETRLGLSWRHTGDADTKLHVERRVLGGAGFAEVTTLASGISNHVSDGLTCGTTYEFRIQARRDTDGAVSPYAADVPQATTLACGGDGQVRLTLTTTGSGFGTVTACGVPPCETAGQPGVAPRGLVCSSPFVEQVASGRCTQSFAAGSTPASVTLRATPATGYRLGSVSGTGCPGRAGLLDGVEIELAADLSCTVEFLLDVEDPNAGPGSLIMAVHVGELRAGVNAVRVAHGLPVFGFEDPGLTAGFLVRVSHFLELRAAIDQAYDIRGMTRPVYADGLQTGLPIRAVHLTELREALARLQTSVVFVSSATYAGNLGGLDGAHQRCQGLADAAGLQGRFRAWLSDGRRSPTMEFSRSGSFAYVRPVEVGQQSGALVAHGWADLTDGFLNSPIRLDEYGRRVTTTEVWTATATDGTPVDPATSEATCADWTSEGAGLTGLVGQTAVDQSWGAAVARSCAQPARLFCVQQ